MCAGVAALLRLHQPQHGPVHAGGERRGGRGQGLAGARPVDGDHPRGGEHSPHTLGGVGVLKAFSPYCTACKSKKSRYLDVTVNNATFSYVRYLLDFKSSKIKTLQWNKICIRGITLHFSRSEFMFTAYE